MEIIVAIGVVIGIIAGAVQIFEYLEKHPEFLKNWRNRFKKKSQQIHASGTTASTSQPPSNFQGLPATTNYLPLNELETKGDYHRACEWVVQEWDSIKSWEILVRYLYFQETLGTPQQGLIKHIQLREKLPGAPPPPWDYAERYYLARLRGQLGLITDAINLHRENIPPGGPTNLFQLKSTYEIAQLAFQVEDFVLSKKEFQQVWERISVIPAGEWKDFITPQTLNFLGTFEMLHIIHDMPFSPVINPNWQIGSAKTCMEYADQAHTYAQNLNFKEEASGWALAVRAFGLEGIGEYTEAEQAYLQAESMLSSSKVRRTSLIYVLCYHAGFCRRRGRLSEAAALLEKVDQIVHLDDLHHHNVTVLEQQSLLAYKQNDMEKTRSYFSQALEIYAEDSGLRTRMEWPKVKRLRKTAELWGIEFDEFFRKNKKN